MTNKFADSFWGEANAGFDVLLQNMKAESTATRELADCLKEKATLEDQYAKGLTKLLKALASIQDSTLGSFVPYWKIIKETFEQQMTVHSQLSQGLIELSKEVIDYGTALRDKTKANVKGEIEAAGESLAMLRSCDAAVVTTKKNYQQACDYQSRQFSKMAKANAEPSASAKTKQVQLEAKIKQADMQQETAKAEHQAAVRKHCDSLMEFQGKFSEACQKFETLEEEYLTRMTGFMGKLSDIQNSSHSQMGILYSSFNENIQEFSVDKLLSLFVENKGTGKTKPVPFKFRLLQAAPASLSTSLADVSVRPESPGQQRSDKERHDSASSGGGGVFGKAFRKKLTKSKTIADPSIHEPSISPVPSVAVDEEGFSIRPDDAANYSSFPGEKDKKAKVGSESDSDFDEEPERNKLKVIKINPQAAPATATVDDIKASLQSIKFPGLVPSPQGGSTHSLDKLPSSLLMEQRKTSTTDVPQIGKPAPDPLLSLLDLDQVNSMNIPPPLVPTTFNSEVFKATFEDMPPLPTSPGIPLPSLDVLNTPPSAVSTISGGTVFFGVDPIPPVLSKAPSGSSSTEAPTFVLGDHTASVGSGLSDQGGVPSTSISDTPAFFADFTNAVPSPSKAGLPSAGVALPPPNTAPPPTVALPPPTIAPPPSTVVLPPPTIAPSSSTVALPPPTIAPTPLIAAVTSSMTPIDSSSLPRMVNQPPATAMTMFPVDFSLATKQETPSVPSMVSQPSAGKLSTTSPMFPVDFSQATKQETPSVPSMVSQPSAGKLSTTSPMFPVDFSQATKQESSIIPGMASQLSGAKLQPIPSLYSTNSGSSTSLSQLHAASLLPLESLPPANQSDPASSTPATAASNTPSVTPLPLLPPPSVPLAFPPPPPASRERSGSNDQPIVGTKSVPRPRQTVGTSKPSPDVLRRADMVSEAIPPVPMKKRLRGEDSYQGDTATAPASSDPTPGGPPTTTGVLTTLSGGPPSTTGVGVGGTVPALLRTIGSGGVSEVSPLATIVLKPSSVGTLPLATDIPIAVAFIETCNAIFKGSSLERCVFKVTGDMTVSFPAGYIDRLQDSPPLQFRVANTGLVDNFIHNATLLTREGDGTVYSFITDALLSHLKTMASDNSAPFYNVRVLRYEVKVSDASKLPLLLASFWKCEPGVTNFRLDYSYNPAALSAPVPVTSLGVSVSMNGGVVNAISKPQAEWNGEQSRMVWKIGDIRPQGPSPVSNALHGKFIHEGQTVPKPAIVQFVCEGATLSGVGPVVPSSGYRISLLKLRCISGQYSAEAL